MTDIRTLPKKFFKVAEEQKVYLQHIRNRLTDWPGGKSIDVREGVRSMGDLAIRRENEPSASGCPSTSGAFSAANPIG